MAVSNSFEQVSDIDVSSDDSFIICDLLSLGFPICYTSNGFSLLFGYTLHEAAGKKCGDLIGGPRILSSSASFNLAAELSGLDGDGVRDSLGFLTRYIAKEVQHMAANLSNIGFAIVVTRTFRGNLLVCELQMRLIKHHALRWKCAIGFQQNISSEVSVREVLCACASPDGREYTRLLAQRLHLSTTRKKLQDSMRTNDDQIVALLKRPDLLNGPPGMNMWQDIAFKASRSSGNANIFSNNSASCSSACDQSCAGNSTASWSMHTSGRPRQDLLERHSCLDLGQDNSQMEASNLAMKNRATLCAEPCAQKLSPAPAPDSRFIDLLEVLEECAADEKGQGLRSLPLQDAPSKHVSLFPTARGSTDSAQYVPALSTVTPPPRILTIRFMKPIEMFHREALSSLKFPFTIADPSLPDCPLLACSVGFTALTGYSEHEIVGQNCRVLLKGVPHGLLDKKTRKVCRAMCRASARGQYLSMSVDRRCTIDLLKGCSKRSLAHGEVVCAQVNATKAGELFLCMMLLKQVFLKSRPFIVGLQARGPDPNFEPEVHDRDAQLAGQKRLHQQTFACLLENMRITEQVLSSEYWYCAGMRRQFH